MGPTRVWPTQGFGRPWGGLPRPPFSCAGRVGSVSPILGVHRPHTCFCACTITQDKIGHKMELCRFGSGEFKIYFNSIQKGANYNMQELILRNKHENKMRPVAKDDMHPRWRPCLSLGVQPWSKGHDGESQSRL